MGAPNSSVTLSYLTDAAHLLHSTAPATSAHLMSQRRDLLSCQSIQPSDVQLQDVCGACGHVLLASGNDSVKLESWRPRRRVSQRKGKAPLKGIGKGMASGSRKLHKGPCKVISCGNCSKATRINLDAPAPATRTRTVASKSQLLSESSTPMTLDGTSSTSKKPTASVSSKKRTKNRKAGLQALLAGQQKGPGSSLNLADLMKK